MKPNVVTYPREFRPLATYDLVRIGAPHDGGYVLPERILRQIAGLLSFGLSDDWEFERQVSQKARVPVCSFDPAVNFEFWIRKFLAAFYRGTLNRDVNRILRGFRALTYRRFFDGERHRHIQTRIGYPGPQSLGLVEAIKVANLDTPLLLKMDIEGFEYRILPDLLTHRSIFAALVIEFHDVDLHEDRIREFIHCLSDTFILVHFHANSHTTIGLDGRPLAIELTFMKRNLLEPGERTSHIDLPIVGLDAPNIPTDFQPIVDFQ